VLADTGPLYALVDSSDALHARAVLESEALASEKRRVIVARSTACEAHSLLRRRIDPSVVQTWLEELARACGLINPASTHYDAAVARLAALPDQSITLFDGVLAELAAHLDMPVWTFDHHFDVMGVPVWRHRWDRASSS
jgi:predicted nucleic acid-binding protein